MKTYLALFIISLLAITSCNDPLKEQTYSTLGPSNFYNSASDAEALLNGLYSNSQGYRDIVRDYDMLGDMTAGIMLEKGGSIHSFIGPMENFQWTSTNPRLEFLWVRYYRAIFRANNILDKVPDINMDEDKKEEILAETRFLRAFNYFYLYDLFGPTPLITTSKTKATDRPKRASKDSIVTFIENQFKQASEKLPLRQDQIGWATKGAALGFLCKFYLNNHQWKEAAETAKQIIDSGVYSLFTKGNRTQLFALKNTGNDEMIYVVPFPEPPKAALGNTYFSHAVPPHYKFKYPPKVDFAAQISIRSDFVNSFNPNDERLGAFLFKYVTTDGDTVKLGHDDVRSFKYPEDPQGVGDVSGNNFPLLRYADILFARAEALNEIKGPNQESIDLINKIRSAAGLNPIHLADYSTKSELRDYILKARRWEFHTEGLSRQDLIRMGKFIQYAQDRGLPAKKYQVLFPIPQQELDKNKNLKQNPGYE
jgi:hypothetical protein